MSTHKRDRGRLGLMSVAEREKPLMRAEWLEETRPLRPPSKRYIARSGKTKVLVLVKSIRGRNRRGALAAARRIAAADELVITHVAQTELESEPVRHWRVTCYVKRQGVS